MLHKQRRKSGMYRPRGCQVPPNRVGAAVVEFAFVAPLMMMMTMGMIEIGRLVMVKQVMVNASREGARRAVLPNADASTIIAQVQSELTSATIGSAQVTVTPNSLATAAAGSNVTVMVSVATGSVSWIPKPMFSINQTMTASTTMRKESQ